MDRPPSAPANTPAFNRPAGPPPARTGGPAAAKNQPPGGDSSIGPGGVNRAVQSKKLQAMAEVKDLEFALKDLLRIMVKHGASDLHVKTGSPPIVRLHGELFPVGREKLTSENCRDLIFSICTRHQQDQLSAGREVDFAFADGGVRFRINAYLQKSTYSASIRMIKDQIPSFKELYLPEKLKDLAVTRQGLILVTGPAGSGKSTTLAAIINYINQNQALHIVTVEDPIEYVHSHKKSIITQREVGTDTNSFKDALKYSLRQDPNVILIGEMRDPESIMIAVQGAETGHLVMSTLHTPNAIQSISRIIDVFSGENQKQIRLLLASNLRAVVSQRLMARDDTAGRVPAVEIMVVTPTIASLIMDDSINDIYKFISEGATEGMQTLNQSLYGLCRKGLITREKAMDNSDYTTELRMMLEGSTHHTSGTTGDDETLMSWL